MARIVDGWKVSFSNNNEAGMGSSFVEESSTLFGWQLSTVWGGGDQLILVFNKTINPTKKKASQMLRLIFKITLMRFIFIHFNNLYVLMKKYLAYRK